MIRKIVFGFVALIVLLWVIGFLTAVNRSRPATPAAAPAAKVTTKPNKPPVVGTSILAVKRFLKDANSASFLPSGQWSVSELRTRTWRVQGEVTAANSFNARVRQPVVVEMVEDGEDMRITFVKIGERIAYGVEDRAGVR